jgi:hypothetical protein
VTSSVSGHARPFARSVAALHGTTSDLLRRVTEPGTAVRREAAYGIAADKLLTARHEPRSIRRTPVRERRLVINRSSFCGSTFIEAGDAVARVTVRVEYERFRRPRPRGGLKHKHKLLVEDTTSYDLHRDGGYEVRVRRIFDREHYYYIEHIDIAVTGEVIRHFEQPLPDHRDRGSAKPRSIGSSRGRTKGSRRGAMGGGQLQGH